MLSQKGLFVFLEQSAGTHPDRIALIEPSGYSIHYGELEALSNRVRDRLHHIGIRRGDRVGVYLHKSIDSVATIFGILKTGASYVPVDPRAPVSRNAYILNDCQVKAIVLENRFVSDFESEWDDRENIPALFRLGSTGGGKYLQEALDQAQEYEPAVKVNNVSPSPEDLAYILYTSGSTGKPKGVMLSHCAAISFVDWCSEVFVPSPEDRFSSHAPFHFDLSILDIYTPIKHGASLVLIDEDTGKDPARLAPLISQNEITIWYSTPSILSFLVQYGKLERYDFSNLRIVLFAGEVFPIKYLRALKNLLPMPRYFNLYGPTETNVCTYFEIPDEISEERTRPYPIGKACSHYQIKVVDELGSEMPIGEEGELCASGPGMMAGYWNLPERTAKAYLIDPSGKKWYKTGDVVLEEADGNYIYIGRRDRMVKKRGYRIELGEIEAGLYRHPEVKEAAVIASHNDEGVRIQAFISHQGNSHPSIIELKQFCVQNLPTYMVPDFFSFLDTLPKTSTDKINYQKLKELAV
jgi:amino acid adenylation domain-containing protein